MNIIGFDSPLQSGSKAVIGDFLESGYLDGHDLLEHEEIREVVNHAVNRDYLKKRKPTQLSRFFLNLDPQNQISSVYFSLDTYTKDIGCHGSYY